MIEIQAPDGSIAEFPDGTPDGVIERAMRETFGGPTPVGEDIARTIPSKLTQGVMGLAGTVGDIQELQGKAGGWVASKLGLPEELGQKARYLSPFPPSPTTSQIREGTEEHLTGPLYEPKTTAGKYVGAVTEMAPSMIIPGAGGRTLLQKGIRKGVQTVVPGVASEAAGQATEGKSYESFARASGAVLGGIASGTRRAKLPTTQQLKTSATEGFEKTKGLTLKPQTFDHIVDQMHHAAKRGGYFPANQTALENALKEFDSFRGKPITLDEVKNLRTVLNSAWNPSNPQMNNAMKEARSRLDELLGKMTPNAVIGEANPQEKIAILRQAQKDWRKVKRLEDIEEMKHEASVRSEANFSQSGEENAMRRRFLRERFNKRRARGYTKEELFQLEKVAGGTGGGNAARRVGKYAPTSPLAAASGGSIGGTIGGAAGFLLGGPPGAAAGALAGGGTVAGTGALMRQIATMSTKKQVQLLEELIKRGGPDVELRAPKLARIIMALQASIQSQRQPNAGR